jgi:hypothetical protein
MTTTHTTMMDLGALEALLDAYGSDRARWPGLKRVAAENLIATDKGAQRLLAEAIAFDRVLAIVAVREDEPMANEQALLDRIVQKAGLTPRLTTSIGASTVIQNASAHPSPALHRSKPRRVAPSQDLWRNAALVAASLILGVYVGQTQLSAYAVPALEEFASRAIGSETRDLALAEAAIDVGDDE